MGRGAGDFSKGAARGRKGAGAGLDGIAGGLGGFFRFGSGNGECRAGNRAERKGPETFGKHRGPRGGPG